MTTRRGCEEIETGTSWLAPNGFSEIGRKERDLILADAQGVERTRADEQAAKHGPTSPICCLHPRWRVGLVSVFQTLRETAKKTLGASGFPEVPAVLARSQAHSLTTSDRSAFYLPSGDTSSVTENAKPDKLQDDSTPLPTGLAPDVIISPDALREQRLPPGQTRTRKWPVLDAAGTPSFSLADWRLEVFGLVQQPLRFSWEEFRALPRVRVFSDFHCVTTWSRLGNLWEGVATNEVLNRAGVQSAARFVILHAMDGGWTTNLPLADFLAEDAVLADTHDGQLLSADHGGPVRAIVPRLYAWKSAKWLCGIELSAEDRPGYWEQAGYHDHGDPWTEERRR